MNGNEPSMEIGTKYRIFGAGMKEGTLISECGEKEGGFVFKDKEGKLFEVGFFGYSGYIIHYEDIYLIENRVEK